MHDKRPPGSERLDGEKSKASNQDEEEGMDGTGSGPLYHSTKMSNLELSII